MQKGVYLLAVIAGLSILTGCPPAQKKAAVDPPELVGAGEISGTPGTAAAGDSAAEVPETAETAAGAPDTAQAAPPAEDKLDAVPAEDELKGRWFALYGRNGGGPSKFTYEDGHMVEFMGNGAAAWTITRSGTGISTLSSTFDLKGGALKMHFDPAGDTSSEYGQHTPLGFGRDQEIGLLSAGRDDEIGLADAKKQDSTGGLLSLDLEVSSDGQYLSIKGGDDRLMVYGRDDAPRPNTVPDLSGQWTGHMSRTDVFPADFKVRGRNIEVKYGASGKGSFRGTWTHGYFVGELVSEREASFAALTPAEGGAINGVYSPDPFNDIRLHFDFTRVN